ncbi:MAG: VOC family protein [Pseudomonadota bacterium]
MLKQIKGLHHVTSLASSAQKNNAFFTDTLGLRRVKKTVNFDAPDVYHLYYGDAVGTPGSVMTYFPFPLAARGKPGIGEVGTTAFSVPMGSLDAWGVRLGERGVKGLARDTQFGTDQITFQGPDGDAFALVETETESTSPWTGNGIGEGMAITGFHSAALRLDEAGATAELLRFMGYEAALKDGGRTRYVVPGGNAANVIDIECVGPAADAKQGAGSVHHLAFAVENRARQQEVREALIDTGYNVTPVIDRDYFHAIYFRTPGGVLFEIATNEPGFCRDEETARLGEALKLPPRYEYLRDRLERQLEPLDSAA